VTLDVPPPDRSLDGLVIIGASAGGIAAIARVLESIPEPLSAPVIVAQHVDPARPSHLREILTLRTKMPVETVEDHVALRPGVVYVVPPDRHVEVSDHELRLTQRDDGGPSPSVDTLLATAAQVFGERLIAVILTGMGSDGADGAWEVKESGGTVIVQDPRTASYPEMPLALAPATVDMIAELDAIGPLIQQFLSGAGMGRTEEDARQMRQLLEHLREQSGIDFGAYRPSTIVRRLRRRMLDLGADGLGEYVQYLRSHPEEYQRLASSFLIKVTHFFRDPPLFDYLARVALPELIKRARDSGDELRMWSAGCATGEEAYSLAMLVAEALGDDLEQQRVRIFATDVDPEALAFARQGLYPAAALKQISEARREKYFTPLEGGYEVKRQLRGMVVFGQHDLGQRSPFPRIDLVLCRNVLIYFAPELQRRALQLFAFALRPVGRLILGKSETVGPAADYFIVEEPGLKIYRRTGNRILIPPSRAQDVPTVEVPPTRLQPMFSERETRIVRSRQSTGGSQAGREVERRALADLPIGLVVVDRRYDIVAINASARRLLEIHSVALGQDLIHLAHRLPSERLREAINPAFRRETRIERFEVRAPSPMDNGTLHLEIGCYPYAEGDAPGEEQVLVTITDVTPPTKVESTLEHEWAEEIVELVGRLRQVTTSGEASELVGQASAALEAARERAGLLANMISQSETTRLELLEANQTLAASNDELQRQNEELMIAQEEAEAAREEIETLSEEQQATNEELETLNEELQATVEELNATNDDLEARQNQLQELASSLETERLSIGAAILLGVDDAMLLVNDLGEPVQANPAFDRLIGDRSFEALDRDGQSLPTDLTPRRRAALGETFQSEFWLEDQHGVRRCYQVSGWPVPGRDIQGALRIRLSEE
jgi:two-component system CheB/CheR fusion protein